jgi:rubrerythrin
MTKPCPICAVPAYRAEIEKCPICGAPGAKSELDALAI